MKWSKFLKRLLSEEAGQSFVVVALAVVVLFGATGMAIDIGNMYSKRSNLQQAVDAGALAGAQSLEQGNSSTSAQATAKTIATENVGISAYDTSVSNLNDQITVTGHENVPTFFARLLGFKYIPVTVSGTAEYGPLKSLSGGVPIGVPKNALTGKKQGDQIDLTTTSLSAGNWGYLNLPTTGTTTCTTAWNSYQNGSNSLDQNLACGSAATMTLGGPVDVKTGKDVSHLADAVAFRIQEDANSPMCNDPNTATIGCNRVVLIPVVDSFGNGTSQPATIVGFAPMWLEPYQTGSSSGGSTGSTNNGNGNGNGGSNNGTGSDSGVVGVYLNLPLVGQTVTAGSTTGYVGGYAISLVN